jgi:single-strand DNA-binding protein
MLTIVGNCAKDPELRYAPSGVAVAQFTVASTPREKNRETDQYEDGTTLWVRVTCFRQMAENVVESLTKGSRVVVSGRLKREVWTDKENNEREMLTILADEVGASLRFASAKINKAGRSKEEPKPVDDPWASTKPMDDTDPPF